MRIKTKVLLLLVSIFLYSESFGQDCTDADDVKAIASDVVCHGGDYLTFNLTITQGGVPVDLAGYSGLKYAITSGSSSIIAFLCDGCFFGLTVENLQVTTMSGTGCPDISTLKANLPSPLCDPALELAATKAIPTIGEWGLIILGLLLTIFGVLAMVNKKKLTES